MYAQTCRPHPRLVVQGNTQFPQQLLFDDCHWPRFTGPGQVTGTLRQVEMVSLSSLMPNTVQYMFFFYQQEARSWAVRYFSIYKKKTHKSIYRKKRNKKHFAKQTWQCFVSQYSLLSSVFFYDLILICIDYFLTSEVQLFLGCISRKTIVDR